jgi:hypothetical protein
LKQPVDVFLKYKQLRDAGAAPLDIARIAVADGLDPITHIRLIRTVFQLSLTEAKEIMIIADDQATSLAEHQASLLPALTQTLAAAAQEQALQSPPALGDYVRITLLQAHLSLGPAGTTLEGPVIAISESEAGWLTLLGSSEVNCEQPHEITVQTDTIALEILNKVIRDPEELPF